MLRIFRWLLVPPSPSVAPWPWIIGSALVTAVLMLGGIWYQTLPAALPVHVVSHSAAWVDDETWRVETEARVTSPCRIEIGRRFNDPPGGRPIRPSASYLDPQQPGDFPYLITAPEGTHSVWYEYQIPPSLVGSEYLIEVVAWQCENGFSGPVGPGRWIVTVGPRP